MPPCPVCGPTDTVFLVFGLPLDKTLRAAEAGLLALGGCVIDDDPPYCQCRTCGVEVWRDGRHHPAEWYGEEVHRPRPRSLEPHETIVGILHPDGTLERLDWSGPDESQQGERPVSPLPGQQLPPPPPA